MQLIAYMPFANTKSRHRNGDPRTYQDLVKGRFEINVKRIERISNYSADTIKQLKRDGYDDAQRYFNEIK